MTIQVRSLPWAFLLLLVASAAFGAGEAANNKGIKLYKLGDYLGAYTYFSDAAEAGNAEAAYNLGVMYYGGQGVAQDNAKAARWFRMGAEGGNAEAMANLGTMYFAGRGVSKDLVEAARWFRRAADSGNVNGMFKLAVLYENGFGVAKDEAEALRWYRMAAAAGDQDAQTLLQKRGQ